LNFSLREISQIGKTTFTKKKITTRNSLKGVRVSYFAHTCVVRVQITVCCLYMERVFKTN